MIAMVISYLYIFTIMKRFTKRFIYLLFIFLFFALDKFAFSYPSDLELVKYPFYRTRV